MKHEIVSEMKWAPANWNINTCRILMTILDDVTCPYECHKITGSQRIFTENMSGRKHV